MVSSSDSCQLFRLMSKGVSSGSDPSFSTVPLERGGGGSKVAIIVPRCTIGLYRDELGGGYDCAFETCQDRTTMRILDSHAKVCLLCLIDLGPSLPIERGLANRKGLRAWTQGKERQNKSGGRAGTTQPARARRAWHRMKSYAVQLASDSVAAKGGHIHRDLRGSHGFLGGCTRARNFVMSGLVLPTINSRLAVISRRGFFLITTRSSFRQPILPRLSPS